MEPSPQPQAARSQTRKLYFFWHGAPHEGNAGRKMPSTTLDPSNGRAWFPFSSHDVVLHFSATLLYRPRRRASYREGSGLLIKVFSSWSSSSRAKRQRSGSPACDRARATGRATREEGPEAFFSRYSYQHWPVAIQNKPTISTYIGFTVRGGCMSRARQNSLRPAARSFSWAAPASQAPGGLALTVLKTEQTHQEAYERVLPSCACCHVKAARPAALP